MLVLLKPHIAVDGDAPYKPNSAWADATHKARGTRMSLALFPHTASKRGGMSTHIQHVRPSARSYQSATERLLWKPSRTPRTFSAAFMPRLSFYDTGYL